MTTTLGADQSFAHRSPADLHRFGYRFVIGYMCQWPGNSKNMHRAEADAMMAGGLDVGYVYEEAGNEWQAGAGPGRRQAQNAVADARQEGLPKGMAIYFAAADYDAPRWQWPAIAAASRAAAAVLAPAGYLLGVYAGVGLVEYLMANGGATYGWVAAGWKYTGIRNRAQLEQFVGDALPGTDRDLAYRGWGSWRQATRAGDTSTPPKVRPQQEEDMASAQLVQHGPHVYVGDSMTYRHVRGQVDLAELRGSGLLANKGLVRKLTGPQWSVFADNRTKVGKA